MTELFTDVITTFDWFVLAYFVVLNTSQFGLMFLSAGDFARSMRWRPYGGHDDIFANPLTPGVSVIVPAFNEEAGIVESVRALMGLKYPALELVVVEDGSTDGTFARLQEAFGLVPTERVVRSDVPTIGRVRSVHAPRTGESLTVVRKENTGRRSDALNVGLNVARQPLVCMVDADSLLDEDALLRVAAPFVDDPDRVVATGGVVRAANGSTVERGRLTDTRMPRGWLARIQVMEYLRSFMLGRTGWSRVGGLLIISGAFGLFRRDVVVEAGGMDLDCIGEDAELVTRLHHRLRSAGRRDYRIVFVPEPVCWTELPVTREQLARQRVRWSRGLAQVLRRHRRMIGNPRYGRIGLVVMPYYVVFELLAPLVELGGIVLVVAGLALGVLDAGFAILLAVAAIAYGVLLSVAAVVVEEFTFHRYRRWRDLAIAVVAAVAENVGYRQLHAWWRLRGLIAELRGGEAAWGEMTRIGFQAPAPVPERAMA